MKTFKLHLIRHGLTSGNLQGLYIGSGTDIPLCDEGRAHNKNPEPSVLGFVAERWGFEPQNAFDTLHDFQSCALDQLSHLSTSSVLSASGRGPQRSTIIPERRSFVKHFFKKVCIFSKMTQLR